MCAGNWFTYAADVRARYQGLRHPPVVPTETLLVGEALALRGMHLFSRNRGWDFHSGGEAGVRFALPHGSKLHKKLCR